MRAPAAACPAWPCLELRLLLTPRLRHVMPMFIEQTGGRRKVVEGRTVLKIIKVPKSSHFYLFFSASSPVFKRRSVTIPRALSCLEWPQRGQARFGSARLPGSPGVTAALTDPVPRPPPLRFGRDKSRQQ